MDEFDEQKFNQEIDDLLADVRVLLGEDSSADTQPETEIGEDLSLPEFEQMSEPEKPEQPQTPLASGETVVFKPLTYYEQSKANYQIARRAEYEREKESRRLAREQELQRRARENEKYMQAMESKLRDRKTPSREEDYSEWLYQQGNDPETSAMRESVEAAESVPAPKTRRKKKTGFLGVLLVLVAAVLILAILGGCFVHFFWAKSPESSFTLGTRKEDCCTILLAGTDQAGYRTDTMMLLNMNRKAKTLSLVSIPRDTLIFCEYSVPKINSAYGYAKGGKKGMQELLTRVSEITGFQPDGYIVVSLETFEQIVDLLGGVQFTVPMDMYYNDPLQELYINLPAGEQTLNGEKAMQLVRFRSGYPDADLGRIQVQRDFVKAAIGQWVSVRNVPKLPGLVQMIRSGTVTNLNASNLAWLAESVLLCDKENIQMATLPGTAAYIADGAYYVLDPEGVSNIVNSCLNPYIAEISASDLSIRKG